MSVTVKKSEERAYIPMLGWETLYHIAGEKVFHIGRNSFCHCPSTGITPNQVRDLIADLEEMLGRVEEKDGELKASAKNWP